MGGKSSPGAGCVHERRELLAPGRPHSDEDAVVTKEAASEGCSSVGDGTALALDFSRERLKSRVSSHPDRRSTGLASWLVLMPIGSKGSLT